MSRPQPAIPSEGEFTDDAVAHISRAFALATSLTGEGFAVFTSWSEEIQHNLLSLIASEVGQAKAAMQAGR
jgi:hypothetical protein